MSVENDNPHATDIPRARHISGWPSLVGAGQRGGEPHLGSHAWPTLNGALLTVIDDSKVDTLLVRLRDIDAASPQLGLRAFTWTVEQAI